MSDLCVGYHRRDVRASWCAISTSYGCRHFCGQHVKSLSRRRYYDIHAMNECANGDHDCEKGYADSHKQKGR